MDRFEKIANRVFAMATTLYHGSSEGKGLQIIHDGFVKPGNLSVRKRGYLVPVAGRSYLAQELRYAVIYAIGGDMLGMDISDLIPRMGRYGYVFVFNAGDIGENQPDEDSIGELIYDGSCSRPCPRWLLHMAKIRLTSNQFQNVLNGEYIYWAQAGKKLVKMMTEEEKKELIDKYGAHVAAVGEIPFRQAWKFDKMKNVDLKKDASNFFQLAERVV